MKTLTRSTFLFFLFALMLAPVQTALAQDVPPLRSDFSYGAGFQSSLPAYGVSGMYDFNANMTGQAILGFVGGLQMYSGRFLYRFNQQPAYNLFGFGTVGLWRYDTFTFGSGSASALGFGGGAGVELNWAQIFDSPTFPPLFSNIEVGFVRLTDDNAVNFSSLSFGAGLHYRFGDSVIPEGQTPPEGPIVVEEQEPRRERPAGDEERVAGTQNGNPPTDFARMQQYKAPGTATLISVFVTGGGHLYSGETGKGLALLGLGYLSVPAGLGVGYALASDCGSVSSCENAYIPIIAGGVVSLGAYIYSLVDAGNAARRSNARLGLTEANLRVKPALDMRGGVASYGFKASVSF